MAQTSPHVQSQAPGDAAREIAQAFDKFAAKLKAVATFQEQLNQKMDAMKPSRNAKT